jgi:FkbM family methyltransferase
MLLRRVANRVRVFRRMLGFRRHLANWPEAWAALRGGTRGVTLRLRNGFTIAGAARDDTAGIFDEIFVERCYTPRWFYRPDPAHTVLDVGANVGVFDVFLCSVAPGIRVHAFEPHPQTFGRLVANLEANQLTGRVTAHNLAVGRERGTVRFAGTPGLDSGHEAATAGGAGEAAECVTLADALGLAAPGPVHLLKIDTEGAEVDILEPAPADLRDRVERVVVEYHTLPRRDAAAAALQARGYHCRVAPTPGYEHHLGLVYAVRG